MRRNRPGRQIGDVGRGEWRHHLFARERLDFGSVGFHHVHAAAAAARLGERTLQHILAERAPELDLDSIFLFECRGERARFGGRHRGVEGQRALLARPRRQPLEAVGALVQVDCGIVGGAGLRAGTRRAKNNRCAKCHQEREAHFRRAAKARHHRGSCSMPAAFSAGAEAGAMWAA